MATKTTTANADTLYLADSAKAVTAEELDITEAEYAQLCEDSESSDQPEGFVRTSTGVKVYAQ